MGKYESICYDKIQAFWKRGICRSKKSEKEALEALKKMFPCMRGNVGGLSSDKNNTWLLSIHEEEI